MPAEVVDQPISDGTTNLDPPTEQEKKETEAHKDELVRQAQEEKNQAKQTGKKQVSVVVTNATASSINSYVSGVVEENGTCTATMTQGSTVVTRTSQGFSNVGVTNCAPINPQLPNGGDWSLVLSYSSANAEGKSSPITFKGQ